LVPICDGCGLSVDQAHIRARIERLEMSTRFRPIHVRVLLMDAAPPAHRGDFFYDPTAGPDARSVAGKAYFDELAELAGAPHGSGAQAGATLAEFQRRGFFLTWAVECPVAAEELNAAVRRLAPTVLRRVQTSYRPKHLALISEATRELIEPFQAGVWGDRLILDDGAPFEPTSAGERLARAIIRLP
jgi:hypothetical protein